MGTVVVQATMSLDGFIADPSGGVGPLFDWYRNGDVEFPGNERTYRVSAASAEYLRSAWNNIGPGVLGRRLFDLTEVGAGLPRSATPPSPSTCSRTPRSSRATA